MKPHPEMTIGDQVLIPGEIYSIRAKESLNLYVPYSFIRILDETVKTPDDSDVLNGTRRIIGIGGSAGSSGKFHAVFMGAAINPLKSFNVSNNLSVQSRPVPIFLHKGKLICIFEYKQFEYEKITTNWT